MKKEVYEGCRLTAYKCPAGKWTIGYGHTSNVKQGDTITQTQADELLKSDLKAFEKAINNLVKVPLNNNQFDALISFVFNIGIANFKKSTLLKYLHQLKFYEASKEFNKWVYSKGKKLNGLVKRRKEERELFMCGVNQNG